jgi:diaminohydroxyphosphoribosylaminopyrimidine deaminase / 5-amino-6-(5-phosphoribosylamino)uracil reductase
MKKDTQAHEYWMQQCLGLASQAEGWTHPNPLVGCVIVNENNQLVGEGVHQAYGQAHAEVHALAQAQAHAKGATAYINLEPCSHHGKTPPCSEALIKAQVKRVVYGCVDPNPQVSGQGVQKLRQAGIEVLGPVCEDACLALNRAFIHRMNHQQPWVTSKLALTLDAKLATRNGDSQWITNEEARLWVHQQRAKACAILSTAQSVIHDQAQLNIRNTGSLRKPPLRIILDSQLRLCADRDKLFQPAEQAGNIIIYTTLENVETDRARALKDAGACIYGTSSTHAGLDLNAILNHLSECLEVTQLWVEAGSQLNSRLLKQGLINEMHLMYGPQILGDPYALNAFDTGIPWALNQAMGVEIKKLETIGNSVCITIQPVTGCDL